MTEIETAALRAEIADLRRRLAAAGDSNAGDLAELAGAFLALGDAWARFPEDDMDAANEPDPDAHLPVMPAHALRRQHAPGGLWTPDAGAQDA